MKCTVLHSSNNRIRVHMAGRKMSRRQADLLYGYLNRLDFVEKGQIIITSATVKKIDFISTKV